MPFHVRPMSLHCTQLLARRTHACFGISPFNSYFTTERITELARWGLNEFRGMHFFVPDVPAAHQVLLQHGYRASIRMPAGVIDPQSKVRVDLLPGGGCLTPRCPVAFPLPTETAHAYLNLPDLISVKLGSFLASPVRRTKDKADVVELMVRNNLSRDLAGIHPAVQALYVEIWDAIQSEPEGPAS